MDHNTDDITSLGSKLDGLELTDGERSILDALFSIEDDVVGHSDLGFGLKITNLLSAPKPAVDTSGGGISGGDLGSGRISSGDMGSGRRDS